MNKFKNVLAFFALIIIVGVGQINAQSNPIWNLGEDKTKAKNDLIQGFNWGQIFHFHTMEYKNSIELNSEIVKLITDKVPKERYENVRFSGTMSNFMNLNELGYGTSDYTGTLWAQLNNQLNSLGQRIAFTFNLLFNKAKALSSVHRFVDESYLVNMVNSYKQLDCKTMAFTFNSHMPYMGETDLSQSLKSLQYIKDNTNLISLELENETYFASYIIGNSNLRKDAEPKIKAYFDYLNSIFPYIIKIVGKDMPIGISIHNGSVQKFRVWNEYAYQFALNKKSEGYDMFLIPHIYLDGYTNDDITKGLEDVMYINVAKLPIRITEWNTDSKAGNLDSQIEVDDFYRRFNEIVEKIYPNADATYYHTLWSKKGAHFSYIK